MANSAAQPTLAPNSAATGAPANAAATPNESVSQNQAASSRAGIGGPNTRQGKLNTCINALQHGLTGRFRVLTEYNEDQQDFDNLRSSLLYEHNPSTPTEFLFVQKMAEHFFLGNRAQRLQDAFLVSEDRSALPLYIRYQTSHERAFHKYMTELKKLQKERIAAEKAVPPQSVSQNSQPVSETTEFVSQNPAPAPAPPPESVSQKPEFVSRNKVTSVKDLFTPAKVMATLSTDDLSALVEYHLAELTRRLDIEESRLSLVPAVE